MTSQYNTVSEFSYHAAKKYVQTVVFVDDRIYNRNVGTQTQPKQVASPKKLKNPTRSQKKPLVSTKEQVDKDRFEEFSPHDIVHSFAKEGVICSLYEPKAGVSYSQHSEVFTICLAADIVIVDWDLHGDNGKNSSDLINQLIKGAVDDVPEQLRLILVYTQELNLDSIAKQLFNSVESNIDKSNATSLDASGLSIRIANCRISVLGKPGRDRPSVPDEHVVEEKNLAKTAVTEFAKLASGLLHAATLLGLAEIRKNSRKILSKFGEDLDPAFLTHRGMSLPNEDVSTHIIPLLVSEIEAVLEDVLPSPLISDRLLKDWCHNIWSPGVHLKELFKGVDEKNYRLTAENICQNGFAADDNFPKLKGVTKVQKVAKFLLSAEDCHSNHRLAHLMASRTFYSNKPRSLQMGTITHTNDKYYLCIQPICDCSRIASERSFLFVPLREIGLDAEETSIVIIKGSSVPISLQYKPKSYFIHVDTFSPDTRTHQVLTTGSEEGECTFLSASGRKYVWIDQLRTSHAQRAVEKFAAELSRVGLTESEWLRLLEP